MVKEIPFYSMCEHHLVPFHGAAHVAYLPQGRVTGLSKLARLVDGFARRPQMQERLTAKVADCLQERLDPLGVLVVVEAEHLCMSLRGVKKPGTTTVTSAVRGLMGQIRRPEPRRCRFCSARGEPRLPAPEHRWRLRTTELDLSGGALMGVLNVTPDSFSDGGLHLDPIAAVSH